MFTMVAYSDLEEAKKQVKEYFSNLQVNRGWPQNVITQLNTWVDAVYTNNTSWLGAWLPGGPGVDRFWQQMADEFPTEINRITNNDAQSLNGVNSVAIVLGSGHVTAEEVERGGGAGTLESYVKGQKQDYADTAQEFVERQRKRNERYEQLAPFILPVAGVAALYVTIKALRPY